MRSLAEYLKNAAEFDELARIDQRTSIKKALH
jgi:hypothetical protein